MSSLLLKLSLVTLILGINSAWADPSALGYKVLRFGYFSPVEWVIPQTLSADRLYVRTKLTKHVTQAQLQVDTNVLLHPIGNFQSTFIPTELAQGYQTHYSDIQVFPLSSIKLAQHQIQLGWTLDNSQHKTLTLKGKKLQGLLKALP